MPTGSNISLNSEMESNFFFFFFCPCLHSISLAPLKLLFSITLYLVLPSVPTQSDHERPQGGISTSVCCGRREHETAASVCCPGRCLSWQHEEEESWAPLSGTTLASESHHLILLLLGTGTQLHPHTATPIPAASGSLALPLIDTP